MKKWLEHEHDFEAIPGIPGRLPFGEHILWQGAPNWKSLAFRVFHVRLVAVYFAMIALWRLATGLNDGLALSHLVASVVTAIVMGGIAVALLILVAWCVGRTTVYTITNKRVLMRIGIALSVTLNLPFARIAAASVKEFADKDSGKDSEKQNRKGTATNGSTGNLSLETGDGDRVPWLMLWPHARPGKFNPAQPTLRCIDDVEGVADILATALEEASKHGAAAGSIAGSAGAGMKQGSTKAKAAASRQANGHNDSQEGTMVAAE